MISACLHDMGTRARLTPEVVPGMDGLAWSQGNWEWNVANRLPPTFEVGLRRQAPSVVTMRPWPETFRGACFVDLTDRYRDLTLRIHQWDQHGARWAPAPGGDNILSTNGVMPTRAQWYAMRAATVAEQQANPAQTPTDWVRQPFRNETSGCALQQPVEMRWHGLPGCRYTFELRDNIYFAPFNLTHPEWYDWVHDDDTLVEQGEVLAHWGDRARLRLYLRPRTWKWWVRTIAHFVYVTPFEEVLNDEVFSRVYWDRPPFEPVRQNVAVNTATADIPYEWFGGLWCSYDPGVDYAFQHSLTASDLRAEIMQQQWWGWCMAYLLTGVEGAVIVVKAATPQPLETIVGLERVDLVSGRVSRIWAQQKVALDAEYPPLDVGTFISEGWF